MSEKEERTSIIGVVKDGIKYKLENLRSSTISDWFFNKRVVVEKAFFGEEYIYTIRLVGDRYFITVDDEEHELFGEPTYFEYWIINDNKREEDLDKPLEYREDGTLILQEIEKGTFVIGRTVQRLNFHEVTADRLNVVCAGLTDEFHLGHRFELLDIWASPDMES